MKPKQSTHLLTADDDSAVRSVISRHFGARGFEVTTASDGLRALELLREQPFSLAILDINMPGLDGLSICRQIREEQSLPVILLTANMEETDRIVGLELGADDYVGKPFSVRELEARVKSVLRRSQGEVEPKRAEAEQQRSFGGWTLDMARRELKNETGEPVSLTGAEYRLLEAFTSHPNRVLSRDQLMNMTRGHDAMPYDRSIDVQVGRLRRKLGDNGKQPNLIKTFRGEGYVLTSQ